MLSSNHQPMLNKSVFIATTEPYSGKSIIALGLLNMLLSKVKKIGYFKPVISYHPKEKRDAHIDTVISYFGLNLAYEDAYAYTREEVMKLTEAGSSDEVLETIISKYKKIEEENDFTIVEGSDFLGTGIAFEFNANVSFAKNLGCPVLIVIAGENKTTAQVLNSVHTTYQNFEAQEVQVLAAFVNKVKEEGVEELDKKLKEQLQDKISISVIPELQDLRSPTMREIYEGIGGSLLFGETLLTNQVDNFITGAMNVPNFLGHLKNNTLIVTPGDRGDIILSALQANQSINYPKVSGIILTTKHEPEEPIIRLLQGLQTVLPIISVKMGTFETTNKVGAIQSRITPDNTKKIQLAISTFEKYVDVKSLDEKIVTYKADVITPHMFQYQLVRRAKSQKKHIVLPEGNEDRILKAAARLIHQDVVELTLLGNPKEITASVKRLGLNLDMDKIEIIDPVKSKNYKDYVETLFELRKNKNVTLDMAYDLMTDVSYFGTMMVYKGHADGMVSGAIHTTQHTIRPALQFVKTRPGVSVVSSVFFMCLPDRVSVFGDCAVNPNPNAEQLAEIAISSAESSMSFGIDPKIAMLSYSSGTSGEGEDVDKVRSATQIVKLKRPDLKVEGPIQYDAAVDPVVGRQKMPGSEVAGQASVLIFPDLNTGNNTYKAVQRETGALAIGPMLQGLNKPVNDLSRGCTVADIFNTVVITAIQAQK
jgi:phosphate acetyltransferase